MEKNIQQIKNEKAAELFAKMREMVRKYRERQAEQADWILKQEEK